MGDTRTVIDPSMFGPLWNEKESKVENIQDGRMDSLLFTILPELLGTAQFRCFQVGRNDASKVFPLLRELVDFVYFSNTSSVSLSLSFAVHVMLTGFLCLQGDGDVQRLALMTKFAYTAFADQIKEIVKLECPQSSYFKALSEKIELVPKSVLPNTSIPREMKAFWNPLVGGSLLLCMEFVGNLREGGATMDLEFQVTITLHLYNGLRKRNLIQENVFIESINKILVESKTIWPGGTCLERGSFTKNFLYSTHASPVATRKVVSFLRSVKRPSKGLVGEKASGVEVDMKQVARVIQICGIVCGSKSRTKSLPLAREWCTSYRMLMDRDFSDIAECERATIDSKVMSPQGVNAFYRPILDSLML